MPLRLIKKGININMFKCSSLSMLSLVIYNDVVLAVAINESNYNYPSGRYRPMFQMLF